MDDDKVIPIRPPEVLFEAGGSVDETRVTFSISGEELDPDAVTKQLGVAPSSAHRRGDRLSERSRPLKQGVWLLTIDGRAPTEPDELVHRLLARLPRESSIWAPLCAAFRVRVIVGLHLGSWNRGFGLRQETIAWVAEIGADLEFDIYFYGDDDAE